MSVTKRFRLYEVKVEGCQPVHVRAASVGHAARRAFRRLITKLYGADRKPVRHEDGLLLNQPKRCRETRGWQGTEIKVVLSALFAFCILSTPALALDAKPNPQPCCIACARCACDRACLCPKASERYVLRDGDYWGLYFVEAKPKTVAEVVAGTIRWAVPHRKPVWIAIPVDKGAK